MSHLIPELLAVQPGAFEASKIWNDWFNIFESYINRNKITDEKTKREFLTNFLSNEVLQHIIACKTYDEVVNRLKFLYTNKSNEQQPAFREEGGFDSTNNMFSSPGQQLEKASKPKCLADVTIKQIIDASEDGIKIKDVEVQMVKVVGIIKQVEVTSVKVRYVIEDHTGSITGFVYLDNETESGNSVVENTYCTVVGSIRAQGGSKHIMIFSIVPVEHFSYILEHMLEVIYMPLKLDSLANKTEEKEIKQEMISSYGTSSYQGNDMTSDIDPKYKRVFDVISRSMSENGMSINEIQTALPSKLPMDQIRNALEYLVGEGHIFTTIDENHYKSIHSGY